MVYQTSGWLFEGVPGMNNGAKNTFIAMLGANNALFTMLEKLK